MSREKITLWIGVLIALGALIAAQIYRLEVSAAPVELLVLILLFVGGIAIATYSIFSLRLRASENAMMSSTQNLRESEARFEQLFNSSPIPMLVTAMSGKVLAANESASIQFGVPISDA